MLSCEDASCYPCCCLCVSLWLWSLCRPLTDCGHCVPPSPPAARAQPGVWCLPVQWGQSRHRVYTQPLATVTLTQAERVVSPCKLHSRILKIITLISEKDKTKYAAYIKQTHSRSSSSILLFCTGVHGWLAAWYDVQVYSNRYRLYSHYLSQVCDGWGPSPDIGVTHYYYGQGGWPGWGPGQATLHWLVLSWPRSGLWSHTRLSAPIMGCQLLNDL